MAFRACPALCLRSFLFLIFLFFFFRGAPRRLQIHLCLVLAAHLLILFTTPTRSFAMFLDSPIPQISISPAPPEENFFEPYSPIAFPVYDDNGFRPAHLTPPPTVTTFKRPHSPLRRVDDGCSRGLETDRFQALLKASKDRNTSTLGVKRGSDLRKEIALKVHKNKQGV